MLPLLVNSTTVVTHTRRPIKKDISGMSSVRAAPDEARSLKPQVQSNGSGGQREFLYGRGCKPKPAECCLPFAVFLKEMDQQLATWYGWKDSTEGHLGDWKNIGPHMKLSEKKLLSPRLTAEGEGEMIVLLL